MSQITLNTEPYLHAVISQPAMKLLVRVYSYSASLLANIRFSVHRVVVA